MSLKCIKFTNGNWLPIYANNTSVYDDRVHTSNFTIVSYGLYNAAITAGNPEPGGGFINPDLIGQTMTDLDGNTWNFAAGENDDEIIMTVTNPGGVSTSKTLDRAYASNSRSSWVYYLTANGYSDGTYDIHLTKSRPALQDRSSTYYYAYILRGYINGYNEETGTIMSSDLALIHTGDNQYTDYGYSGSHLRNLVPGNPFVNAIGHFLCTKDDNNTLAKDFYPGPFGAGESQGLIASLKNSIEDVPQDIPDPFEPGGNTGPGGGSGDLDDTSDPIDIPPLPSLSAVDTGFISLYNPSLTELKNLANYMWTSPLFDPANWRKLFADPMDAILGLSIVPVAVPNGGIGTVTVGNLSTGINMNKAASQYVEVDCGSIDVTEYWGAYLDYSPFTSAELYLPYIGTHPINIDDIMGKTVTVKYHVDILTGACTAFVKCGDSVLYEFIGQCSSSIPISGRDFTNVMNGVINIAGAIGSMVATGGVSAPMAISTAADVATTANNIIKPNIEKSGSMSGTGGMLGVQTPYLILTRPKQAVPSNQNAYTGYPSFITTTLGSLTGYTEIEKVHLSNIPGTPEEVAEIEELLRTGVIL